MAEVAESKSLKTLQALALALGLGGRDLARIVIVCDEDEPPTAYYVERLNEDCKRKCVDVLSLAKNTLPNVSATDIVVDGGCNVFVQEKEEKVDGARSDTQ